MQSIYNYVLETNHVSWVYSAAAVLHLPFVQHVMIFHILSMFCTFTLVLFEVCVQCPVWMHYVVTWFPSMLLRYCLNDFGMIPVDPVITGITVAFTFHMHWISVVWSLYFIISDYYYYYYYYYYY
jgi:hypothetical protein